MANANRGRMLLVFVATAALLAASVTAEVGLQLDTPQHGRRLTALGAAGSDKRALVLKAARSQIGVPYSWGGGHKATPGKSTGTCAGYTGSIHPCPATRTVGFDCSGLTRYAYFKGFGKDINNGATGTQEGRLQNAGKRTSKPVPGDLIFWTGHTAIFSGKGYMIEAQKTGTKVHEVKLRSGGRYYHY